MLLLTSVNGINLCITKILDILKYSKCIHTKNKINTPLVNECNNLQRLYQKFILILKKNKKNKSPRYIKLGEHSYDSNKNNEGYIVVL